MLTLAEALKVASGAMVDINSGKFHPMIWEEHTVERDHVFAFLCNTREYKESGNSRHSLFGIGPIIVSRCTAAVVICGNRTDWDESIDEYEQRAAGVAQLATFLSPCRALGNSRLIPRAGALGYYLPPYGLKASA